jgi:DNA-binding PadR family transcriptional regulator
MARSDVLELAVLGLLHDAPMHGYELRKRLAAALGPFRALGYGTLYPTLRRLSERGWITGRGEDPAAATAAAVGRRGRIVYELTPAGRERFAALVHDVGPASWEDESFDVRLAFFSRTAAEVRLRVLEGRRSRLEERLQQVSVSLARSRERADRYSMQLQRHGLESVQHEVRWVDELISAERSRPDDPHDPSPQDPDQSRTT